MARLLYTKISDILATLLLIPSPAFSFAVLFPCGHTCCVAQVSSGFVKLDRGIGCLALLSNSSNGSPD